jgi:Fic family protein
MRIARWAGWTELHRSFPIPICSWRCTFATKPYLSSQIEGTQSTLEDVLEFEAGGPDHDTPSDVEQVVNYVRE